MIGEPPPWKGLNVRVPSIIPIKGRGFINQGSGLDMFGFQLEVTSETGGNNGQPNA